MDGRALRHWQMPADPAQLPALEQVLFVLKANRRVVDESYVTDLEATIQELKALANWQPDGPVTDDSPLSVLEMPTVFTNKLGRRGTKTIGQLRQWTAEDLSDISGFGELLMDELLFKLSVCKITLRSA